MTSPAAPTVHPPAMRSALLAAPGAVADDGPDAGVAAHYGDPMTEQRALVEGRAVVDLSHRNVLAVTGADRLSWLNSLTTQQLRDLPPYAGAESLVLSPRGHVEHALHVVDDGETTWLSVEPGTGEALRTWLDSMRFMLRVEVSDRTADVAVVGEPSDAPGGAGEPIAWVDPWPGIVGDSAAYGPIEGHPGQGRAWREVLVPRADLEEYVGERPLAGTWAAEALRIAAWRPRLGFETDHRTIVHEVDWLRTAVHLHKGCYRGQETVARVRNLGRPPRRLAFVHLDGSEHVLPRRGASVEVAGRTVGTLTSVGRHHELGPIALALLKRSAPEDAVLHIEGIAGAQELIVGR